MVIFVGIIFTTHVVGCLWYMLAMADGFEPLSWVVRQGIQDESVNMKYLQSIYWALQTLTTVGFGDIGAKTVNERIFAMLWMLIGIAFYSIMFGNITNLLDNLD
jgi:hypothetical protein